MKKALLRAATSLWLILFVALAARLGFAWDQERKIPREVLGIVPFQQETGNIAYSLAQGKGYSNPFRRDTGPTAWLTPVYPLLIAGLFKIFGVETIPAFFAAVFLNSLFSTAACIPLFYVGKRISGIGVASGAAWLWALLPHAVMFPFEWIWDTSLSALLAATLLWATLALPESARLRDWCGYGLLWGFTLMTNPSLGSLLPFLLGWAALRAYRQRNTSLSQPLLAFGLAILCCAPWTIRNYRVFHKFIPLRSNFGLELYIGNNENYDPQRPQWPSPITKEREILRFFKMGEIPFMEEEMRKATAFMVAHPGVEVKLTALRVVTFWMGTATPLHDFLETDSLLIKVIFLCNLLAALGVLVGIFVLYRQRNPFRFPIAAFPVIFPLAYYLTHTSLRYRHPIDPIVMLLVAVAAFWPCDAVTRRRFSEPATVSKAAQTR
jgi:hypothetical protein